ncbi:molecular chaperone DnaK [Candidatus Falkowbacteria bacterium HGW-Falkowbacteria-1]|jgi:RNA polymerase-binding protein DksA|uniref:Molecular chaperone DnaK n=1 Tax=Candidatus Falkowbacteria bacterium HGW-Falkowbacteria-1 TaxID=2013768 RepID=A0A2N2E903_9BACT|nr:MAG: molecular chaperone DnaK [Candidatus Falkowbacteria bacterium HGW-Falkowbacteria-1]
MIDEKKIEKIKKDLLKRKEQILQDLQDLSKKDTHETDNRTAKFPEYGDKPDENAQEISEYSTTVVTEKVIEKTLEEIDGALDRIEKGIYDVCKYCGGEISEKRLEARSTASSCIDCKTKLQEEND